MALLWFSCLALLLLAHSTQGKVLPATENGQLGFAVPLFRSDEIADESRIDQLRENLGQSGLVSWSGSLSDREEFEKIRQAAFSGLCRCMTASSDMFNEVRGSDEALLTDGTTRRTIASATVGNIPHALDQEALEQAGCTSETIQAMDALRDQVAWLSQRFVSALDRILGRHVLLETEQGRVFTSVSSVVKASQNLEHFHLYDRPHGRANIEDSVLEVHTDAGMFLAFVPGMECSGASEGDFYVQQEGKMKRAEFEAGSIGIMLGIGAEHWLSTSQELRATRHAVRMEPGQKRMWYGMSKSFGRVHGFCKNDSEWKTLTFYLVFG